MSTHMPATRRVVTGHDADGKAIFESDQVLKPANPLDPEGEPPSGLIPGFTTVFRTTSHPASAQEPWTDPHAKMQNLVGDQGVVCRIVDFPPVANAVGENPNIMHRTHSVDYGVVLDGEIAFVLDDGVQTVVRKGDVFVQRGTVHCWTNHTNENCRVFFVLVPARPIEVERTGEVLPATDTSHLEKPQT